LTLGDLGRGTTSATTNRFYHGIVAPKMRRNLADTMEGKLHSMNESECLASERCQRCKSQTKRGDIGLDDWKDLGRSLKEKEVRYPKRKRA
jgi:hypothetical protein